MITTIGHGAPGDLVKPILHHASGVQEIALAILAGLWAHDLHRDRSREHELHIGRGPNNWNLYLDDGHRFAFRGAVGPGGDYDRIEVHADSVRPVGPVVLTLRDPADTDRLWELFDDALSAIPAGASGA